MARGDSTASTAESTSAANSGKFTGNANSLYGDLAPTLESEVAHPAGYAPSDLSAMETGAQQSAGGSQAGAVGQGGLFAARTGNKGGAAAAIADASRGAGQQLSKNLLGIRSANANLKNEQQQAGISGLTNLTGLETGASNNALSNISGLSQANTAAENASWDWSKDLLAPILQAAGQGAGLAAGCWIASAIYGGESDPRTHIVRAYLNGPFRENVLGDAVMRVYLKIGQQVAWFVCRSSWLRAAFKPLFDIALRKATK